MNTTLKITIRVTDLQVREELIALLSNSNYDAFEEGETELMAFIGEESFDEEALSGTLRRYGLNYTHQSIRNENWNALWESNFAPVEVEKFCSVRAHFHSPNTKVRFDIMITPKMSFGTGHHATTYMMISQMENINCREKIVCDFGTGTGVLAILAEKMGAARVVAIDNDEWSIANAKENLHNNGCQAVHLQQKEGFDTGGKFDIILANINKNVILLNAEKMVAAVTAKGYLLLSGLLQTDEEEILLTFKNSV